MIAYNVQLDSADVALAKRIARMSPDEVADLPDVPSRRVTTLSAAALVLSRVLKQLKPEQVVFSTMYVVGLDAAFGEPTESFSCTVDYGDGEGAVGAALAGNTCTGPAHIYADNGEAALAEVHARGSYPESALVRRSSLEDVFLRLSHVSADIAHELRTPLHIIQGNLEGVLDGVYEPTPEHLDLVLDEDHRRSRVLDDVGTLLRGVGRIDAGRCRTDRHGRDVEDHPLRGIRTKDRDRIAGFDAECDERARRRFDLVDVVPPARHDPLIVSTHTIRIGGSTHGTGVDDLLNVVGEKCLSVHPSDELASVHTVAIIHDPPELLAQLDDQMRHARSDQSAEVGFDLVVDIISM